MGPIFEGKFFTLLLSGAPGRSQAALSGAKCPEAWPTSCHGVVVRTQMQNSTSK